MNKAIKHYLQAMQDDLHDINEDIAFFTQLKEMYHNDNYDTIIANLKVKKRDLTRHITSIIKDRLSAEDILEVRRARKS